MMRSMQRIKRVVCLVISLAVVLGMAVQVSAAEIMPTMMPVAAAAAKAENLPTLRSAVAVHHRATPYSLVIGYMEDGTELTVLGASGDYYHIDCYDMTGYIEKALVREADGKYFVQHRGDSADSGVFTSRSLADTILLKSDLHTVAVAQEGIPYAWGGTSRRGFDCSGFTQYVYRQSGITIPRTCEGQLAAGIIIPKESLQCGDLVLFHRTNHPTALVTHVGMYLGDGKLIHAGSGGITIVDLDSRYFAEHYLCARRVVLTDDIAIENLSDLISGTAAPAAARRIQTRSLIIG